ncbi:hypothetical protein GJU40_18405 [Bacillus lacus]|uniref:Uncharacterized protein n=1 Tax=Metabacillus lacus TaxID=1983721 RepID=A0A7X2J2J0_9BACI|nr:hypothetical protein [Metabacillus lacus]MRX74099.1 hypothetical protein [Metabacillus lacus]
MASQTIQELLAGDTDILTFYSEADNLWEQIWADKLSENEEGLAQLLTDYQTVFEDRCGGKTLGREVMAYSGYGYLYSANQGFENDHQARRLRQAFPSSTCSLEVKAAALKAADVYHLA